MDSNMERTTTSLDSLDNISDMELDLPRVHFMPLRRVEAALETLQVEDSSQSVASSQAVQQPCEALSRQAAPEPPNQLPNDPPRHEELPPQRPNRARAMNVPPGDGNRYNILQANRGAGDNNNRRHQRAGRGIRRRGYNYHQGRQQNLISFLFNMANHAYQSESGGRQFHHDRRHNNRRGGRGQGGRGCGGQMGHP